MLGYRRIMKRVIIRLCEYDVLSVYAHICELIDDFRFREFFQHGESFVLGFNSERSKTSFVC